MGATRPWAGFEVLPPKWLAPNHPHPHHNESTSSRVGGEYPVLNQEQIWFRVRLHETTAVRRHPALRAARQFSKLSAQLPCSADSAPARFSAHGAASRFLLAAPIPHPARAIHEDTRPELRSPRCPPNLVYSSGFASGRRNRSLVFKNDNLSLDLRSCARKRGFARPESRSA